MIYDCNRAWESKIDPHTIIQILNNKRTIIYMVTYPRIQLFIIQSIFIGHIPQYTIVCKCDTEERMEDLVHKIKGSAQT